MIIYALLVMLTTHINGWYFFILSPQSNPNSKPYKMSNACQSSPIYDE